MRFALPAILLLGCSPELTPPPIHGVHNPADHNGDSSVVVDTFSPPTIDADVLVVVDHSCSMDTEQTQLADLAETLLDDLLDTVVGRVLDQLGVDVKLGPRWNEEGKKA